MASKKSILLLLFLIFILTVTLSYLFLLKPNPELEIPNSNIQKQTYIAPYLGDIDGEVSEDWFFFYEKALKFHEENNIPVTFSFFPASIQDDKEFNNIMKKIYQSTNIELMQKGYKADDLELQMDRLPYEQQRQIIRTGQQHFKKKMQEITNKDTIKLPIAYNQIGARFTNDTRKALEFLGFKIYFDVFIGDRLPPIESTNTFDVLEYGVSFTRTGDAGKENKFRSSEEIFQEISTYHNPDVKILTINKIQIIPLWAHQQDFELQDKENVLDKKKWETYQKTLLSLKKDPNVIFITPTKLYNLRHPTIN